MEAHICILLLSLLRCLSGVHLTKELEIKPPFERFLVSRHHLLDWFGIVKSERFRMDFSCEKLRLRDQSSRDQMI